ncbi:MAG: ThuA domain-containing protein [Maribacter sp.]|nr:ThuA domain-containing protein [Maribacter sp.]
MRKIIKIVLWSILGLFLLLFLAAGTFIYKARYGINFYETTPPDLPADLIDKTVLLFSKTNGFRHGEAIAAAIPAFEQMAGANGWTLYETDNGAIFNPDQLAKFDVVVWNNTSGKVLNEGQREAFKKYLEGGGGYLGIHASGDNSHQWDWYEDEVIGARFSHHPINPQFQNATLHLKNAMPELIEGLPTTWSHDEEWYMFFNDPRENGCEVIYTFDDTKINPSGNIKFLASDKDWGMGKDHPAVWYHEVDKGRAFYSALGHQGGAFQEKEHLQLLENAVRWAGKFSKQ